VVTDAAMDPVVTVPLARDMGLVATAMAREATDAKAMTIAVVSTR